MSLFKKYCFLFLLSLISIQSYSNIDSLFNLMKKGDTISFYTESMSCTRILDGESWSVYYTIIKKKDDKCLILRKSSRYTRRVKYKNISFSDFVKVISCLTDIGPGSTAYHKYHFWYKNSETTLNVSWSSEELLFKFVKSGEKPECFSK